jgi:lactoylglutathione lyase
MKLRSEGDLAMKCTGMMHAAIRVRDAERSLAFYTGKLGFQEMFRQYYDDGSLWNVYVRVTDDQFIEIFPNAEDDRAPGNQANGLNHICLTVEDIDACIDELARIGVPLTRPRKIGADRNVQVWIEDPDGNRIEIMQMAPDSRQREAIMRLKEEAMAG